MYAPLLIPLCGLVAGIIIGSYGAGYMPGIVIMVTGCALYLLFQYLSRDPLKSFRINRFHFLWIFIVFCGTGVISYDFNKPGLPDKTMEKNTFFASGTILSFRTTSYGEQAIVKVDAVADSTGKVHRIMDFKLQLNTGFLNSGVDDIISFPAAIERISDSDNSFRTGYASTLERQGILYRCSVDSKDITRTGHITSISGIAQHIRDSLEIIIEKSGLDRNTVNFLITILLGDRAYMNPDIRQAFSDAGISHILALSGMHTALIAMIILWILFPMNFFGKYKLRMISAALLLLLYAFITGMAPSTVRASVMALTLAIGFVLERKTSAWNALTLAAFVILLVQPSALYDVGMQLSVLCVASLIFFANRLNPIDHRAHPVIYKISAAFLASIVTTLATWIVCARYFGTVPVMFLPANIIVLPFIPVYLTIAIIYIALSAHGINLSVLKLMLDGGYDLLCRFVEFLTAGGTSTLQFSPTILQTASWIIGVIFLAVWLNGRKRFPAWIATAAFALFGVTFCIPGMASDRQPDGFIIRRDSSKISVAVMENGRENIISFEERAISAAEIAGRRILIVDAPLDHYSPPNGREDIVVIGKWYEGSMEEIDSILHPRVSVIHPVVSPARERKLTESAQALGLLVHSIRHKSPYRHQSHQ